MILEIGGWLVVGLEEPIPSMEGHEYRNPLFGEIYVDFGDGVVKNMYYVCVHVYAYAHTYIYIYNIYMIVYDCMCVCICACVYVHLFIYLSIDLLIVYLFICTRYVQI